MKVLKKVSSVILVAAMLLSNSKSLAVYANEQITESNLVVKEENTNPNEVENTDNNINIESIEVKDESEDVNVPEIRSVSVDKNVVKPGDKVTISIDMFDDKSGINLDKFGVALERIGTYDHGAPEVDLVYNEKSEKYEFTIEINGTVVNGIYAISRMVVSDNAGNRATLDKYTNNSVDLSAANFEVVGSIDEHEEIIKSVSIDNNKPKVGDVVNISLELANNIYIDEAVIEYRLNEVGWIGEQLVEYVSLKYNESTNRYEGKLEIKEVFTSGILGLYNITLKCNDYKWLTDIRFDSLYDLAKQFRIEAVSKENEKINVSYKTHVEDYGWQEWNKRRGEEA